MKVEDEGKYVETLEAMKANETHIKKLKRDNIVLENSLTFWQASEEYANNRNIIKFSDRMKAVNSEMKTLKSLYVGEK